MPKIKITQNFPFSISTNKSIFLAAVSGNCYPCCHRSKPYTWAGASQQPAIAPCSLPCTPSSSLHPGPHLEGERSTGTTHSRSLPCCPPESPPFTASGLFSPHQPLTEASVKGWDSVKKPELLALGRNRCSLPQRKEPGVKQQVFLVTNAYAPPSLASCKALPCPFPQDICR